MECLNSGTQGRSHGHSGRGGGVNVCEQGGFGEQEKGQPSYFSEYEAVVCNVDPNKYVKFISDIVAHWSFPVCFVWL